MTEITRLPTSLAANLERCAVLNLHPQKRACSQVGLIDLLYFSVIY